MICFLLFGIPGNICYHFFSCTWKIISWMIILFSLCYIQIFLQHDKNKTDSESQITAFSKSVIHARMRHTESFGNRKGREIDTNILTSVTCM